MPTDFHDDLKEEYFKLVDIVAEFDRRMLTVKGWGVTLSLAALAWGFEKEHYGLFLVASLSALGFWIIEGVLKRHQMRTYIRMREIEVVCYELFAVALPGGGKASSPLIDWTWVHSWEYFLGHRHGPLPPPQRYGDRRGYRLSWLFLIVAFPHILTVVAGALLFTLGLGGKLGMKL
jgi:hypothetical protein